MKKKEVKEKVKMNKDTTEYEKDLNEMKEQILKEGDALLTKRDLLERFCKIGKEYHGDPWNLLQILANINILIGQESCEDAISRQAVLDLVNSDWKYEGLERDVASLPPITPKPKIGHWIPVSERLPESAGVYIVTREFTDGFECADLTDACYFDGTSTWHNDNRINHGREYVDKKIKAWMPLPKPYEPQAEYKDVHCNCTDEEIAKSFISDVETVKDLLPQAESEDNE